jgi:hypothetical protein
MKNHLQSHIKGLIRHNAYLNFTAEPVVARQRRLASETSVATADDQTTLKIVKFETSQGGTEKENSDVVINARDQQHKTFLKHNVYFTY